MSGRRIHKEAQMESQIEFHKFLNELKKVIEGIEDLGEEEQAARKLEYTTRLEERINQIKTKIDAMKNGSTGKAWDFSKERALEIFVEDEEIVLHDHKIEDLEKFIQIKNADSTELYANDEQKMEAWQEIHNENAFCCSIHRKVDNEYIGYIAVKDSRSNLWEIAIELLQKHCNQGYGARAIQWFLPAVSQITGKKQFQALVETDNIPSQLLMEKLGARLIDIYNFSFIRSEDAKAFEEKHLDRITDRMIELAEELEVEPRKMLSHVLDYRIFIENGKVAYKR